MGSKRKWHVYLPFFIFYVQWKPHTLFIKFQSFATSMDPEMPPFRPLLAICGTTGVGKSKLAVELALRLSQNNSQPKAQIFHGWNGARIINADSMQVYAGLDIITNKIPVHEQRGVEHALMGFKKPGEQYVVGEWVTDAIREVCRSALHFSGGLSY